jgi:hypothetical protein
VRQGNRILEAPRPPRASGPQDSYRCYTGSVTQVLQPQASGLPLRSGSIVGERYGLAPIAPLSKPHGRYSYRIEAYKREEIACGPAVRSRPPAGPDLKNARNHRKSSRYSGTDDGSRAPWRTPWIMISWSVT